MLCILGTLDQGNAVFSKDYIKPMRRTLVKEPIVIQNNGFFDNLPLSKKRGGRLRIGMPVVQTKSKQERKIEELQARMQAFQERTQKQIDQQRESLIEE